MTKSDPDLSGEARLKRRRSRFYRYLGLAFLVSIVAGMASGTMVSFYENGLIPLWLPLLAFAIAAAGLVWFTRDYFKRVDELDRMDNLWAHLIGLYGGFIVFCFWYLLADLGVTGEPSGLGVVGAMLLITFAAYGARKLGLR